MKKIPNRLMLIKGDKIRMKVRTMSGWKGTGTVTENMSAYSDLVQFSRDDIPRETSCFACRHEVSKIRNPSNATNSADAVSGRLG